MLEDNGCYYYAWYSCKLFLRQKLSFKKLIKPNYCGARFNIATCICLQIELKYIGNYENVNLFLFGLILFIKLNKYWYTVNNFTTLLSKL